MFPFGQSGQTALHWAAMNGHEKVIEILLAAGAEVNAADKVIYDFIDTV